MPNYGRVDGRDCATQIEIMKTPLPISDPLANNAIGTRRDCWRRAQSLGWPTVTIYPTGERTGGSEGAWTVLCRDGTIDELFDAYLALK